MISERSETIVARPRLAARLALGAVRPILILAAPAGFGKSCALRQFIDTHSVRSLHFVARPGSEARRCLLEELEKLSGFDGIVAVDDLHHLLADPAAARALAAVVGRSQPATRWALATRSLAGLPVGTWLAYGQADFVVSERELRFTSDETREAARAIGATPGDEALAELQRLTRGWPACVSLALRAARGADGDVRAATREMMHRFIEEQIFEELDSEERSLLELSTALPTLDVALLELAGFDRALEIVERVRTRTSLIEEPLPGTYRCDEIFEEYLRRRLALAGRAKNAEMHARAAYALERSGNAEAALRAWSAAGSTPDLVRVFERNGFDLIERARTEAVTAALEALDERTRRENAHVLALRGLLQAAQGRPARADGLLRRALRRAHAAGDRDLFATISLRLALIAANRGEPVSELLHPVADDALQQPPYRAEALSLLAAERAIGADASAALTAIDRVETILPSIELDATRARILQRLGVALVYIGQPQRAREALSQAAELATELQLHSLASRAYSGLLMISQLSSDADSELQHAKCAAEAAACAGDTFDLESALMQVLSIEMRFGNLEQSVDIEERIKSLRSGDSARNHYLAVMKALRLAWDGRFGDAHRLLSASWRRLHHDFDRLICASQCMLFLALDGRREESISVARESLELLSTVLIGSPYQARSVAIARLLLVVGEIVNRRASRAERLLVAAHATSTDTVINSAHRVSRAFLRLPGQGCHDPSAFSDVESQLFAAGYGGIARLIRSILPCIRMTVSRAEVVLTPAERTVLRLLAEGLTAKEIAARSGRSVFTVRAHIANAISKLGSRGRIEAIATARRIGVIT